MVNWKQVVAKFAALQGLFDGPVFNAHHVDELNDDTQLEIAANTDEKKQTPV